MQRPTIYLLILPILFLLACGEVTEPSGGAAANRDSATDTTGELQGVWRSEDDSLHTLTFEGNLMIMSYQGEEQEVGDNFVVGQTCPDAPDAIPANGKGRYLSAPDIGNCYFITKLNDKRLEMSLVGRGNKLRYVRVVDGGVGEDVG